MSELHPVSPPPPPPPRRAPAWPIILTLLIAAAIAGGLYWFRTRPVEVAPAPTVKELPPAKAEEARPPSIDDATAEAKWREAVLGLSSTEAFQKWMKEPGIVRRLVGAVTTIAEGGSPRALLGFMAPKGAFQVVEKDGVKVISPESFARYDPIVLVIGGIDPRAAGAAYAKISPVLESIYAEVGPPGSTFASALKNAIARLGTVPIPEGELAVVEDGATWRYSDASLEARTQAEKHLLRMGPDNMRLLQAHFRAFEDTLPK